MVYNGIDLALANVRHDLVPECGGNLGFFFDAARPQNRSVNPLTFDHEMSQVD